MADRNGSDTYDIDDWTNSQEKDSHLKRAHIIDAILRNRLKAGTESVKHLRTIVNSGWDINEVLYLHDSYGEWIKRTTLNEASRLGWIEGVKILLDAGAECAKYYEYENPVKLALQSMPCQPDLFDLLLKHGAGSNDEMDSDMVTKPLLHRLVNYFHDGRQVFLPKLLDLFFMHGRNIHMTKNCGETALEYAVSEVSHVNSVRWLLRHGAGPLPELSSLHEHFKPHEVNRSRDIPLVLLEAGMRFSPGIQKELNKVKDVIITGLEEDSRDREKIQGMTNSVALMLSHLVINEMRYAEQHNLQSLIGKVTYTKYLAQQMDDLLEFSDESLHIYPEDQCLPITDDIVEQYQPVLDMIHKMLEFLSQPKTLLWYCRRSVRENLVSLQPSVVKSLPVPSRLKCYILCHDL